MKTFKLMVILMGAALGSVACDGKSPTPESIPRPKPKGTGDAGKAAAAPPAAGPVYVYAYNPVGKRDPFRSPQPDGPAAQVQRGPCNELLCQFNLEQLKLVAVITGDANPMAMVEDPAGRGHVVRRNTRVGRQGGKVTAILRDSVTVTEYVPSGGKLVPSAVSLQLKVDAKMEPPLDLGTGELISGEAWGR